MRMIFSSPDTAELELLQNVLEKAGIKSVELNGEMAQEIPALPCQAELWVEEVDYADASAFVAEWRNPTTGGTPWVCPRCHRPLESQFTKCWKCGTRRGKIGMIPERYSGQTQSPSARPS